MDDTIKSLGWLSPTGEFVPCHSYDHAETAREILRSLHRSATKEDITWPEDVLTELGWAYIGVSSLGQKEYRIGWGNHLTPEQVMFLRPYFEDKNIPTNLVARDKFEFETN